MFGDDFGEVSRARAQVGRQVAEGVQAVSHEPVHAYAISVGLILRALEGAEQPGRSRDGTGHEAKLAQVAEPLLVVDALHLGEFLEDLSQGLLAMRRELDGLA
jgi:hypothetical protein